MDLTQDIERDAALETVRRLFDRQRRHYEDRIRELTDELALTRGTAAALQSHLEREWASARAGTTPHTSAA